MFEYLMARHFNEFVILNPFAYRYPIASHSSLHIDQGVSICLFNTEENAHSQ